MADTDLLKALRRGAHNIHSIGPVHASDLLTQAADALELHHPVVDPLSGHISLVTPPRRDLLDPRLLSHHITPDADLRSACWLALERLESALARVENLEVEHRKARATIDRQGTELGELRRLGPIKRTLEERTAAIPHDLLSPEQRARVRDWIRSTLSSRRAGVPFKCSCPQGCADRLAMRAAHGTPEQFIVAISAAGAELSIAEKDIAVARYCDEWAAAPAGPVDLALAIDAQLRQDDAEICLSTPIGAPSLAIAEQFDAEARAAAEEPGTPGDMMEHISDFERCYEPIDDPDEYP